MLRAALIVILALMLLSPGAILWAQGEEPPPPEDIETIIEEILRLRGEANALLESLPPELRKEVERRWEVLQTAPLEAPAEEGTQPEAAAKALPEPVVTVEESPSEPTEGATEEPAIEQAERQTAPEDAPMASTDSPQGPEPEPEPAKSCDSLGPFDTNGDGIISAADRNWRYLRLQTGITGRVGSSGDLESLYELGVREIDVNLRFFKMEDDSTGDITIDDRIRFHLFSKRKSGRRNAILFVQADRLARGQMKLVDSTGTLLAGDQAFAPGMALKNEDGQRLPILCP